MSIGNWIRRVRGKWHLIESLIEGDAVTRCGRRIGPTTGQGMLMFSDVMPLTRMIDQPQLCKGGCES